MLVRRLVADPSLDGTACVVLDEFHERSLDADLSLAMLREAKSALRPDLRLIVMSATLDADAVAAFLGENAEILHVPGRLFPVEVEHRRDDPRPVEERVARVLEEVWSPRGASFQLANPNGETADGKLEARPTGDVLVFLPGVREIEATMDAVRPVARRHGYGVVPLHGSLDKDEQDAAVRFDPTGPPRVICATNVAETSLTLPGVRTVIDSGLVRRAGYDARRGVATLTTERISKASAEQRAGRAGRVAEGRCVRLWSAMTHRTLPDYDLPEVRRADLCDAALTVRAWGGEPASFGWYEPPDADLLAAADHLLEMLGATDGGRLTKLGRRLQDLPLHPRLARLLVAAPPHLKREAATVAALIGEQVDVPGRRTASVRDLLAAHDAGKLDAPGLTRARDACCGGSIRVSPPTSIRSKSCCCWPTPTASADGAPPTPRRSRPAAACGCPTRRPSAATGSWPWICAVATSPKSSRPTSRSSPRSTPHGWKTRPLSRRRPSGTAVAWSRCGGSATSPSS